MKCRAGFLGVLVVIAWCGLSAPAGATIPTEITLWLDDESTYMCDDPFVEAGCTVWLTETTAEDCISDSCNFGWSEGVIYMHPVRVMVDLTTISGVDSAIVYYWGPTANDMRAFLYGSGALVDSAHGQWYGDRLVVASGGQAVDQLAISACESELYEVVIHASDPSTSVGAGGLVPAVPVSLAPPTPNPFNPITTLSFEIAEPGRVRLDVYDTAGRHVADLLDRPLASGQHSATWQGTDRHGNPVPSGVYFARLESHNVTMMQKMVLAR